MPIDFSSQASDMLNRLGATYQAQHITAEIIGLLQEPLPQSATYEATENAWIIAIAGHMIIYRYIKDLALIQIIAIKSL